MPSANGHGPKRAILYARVSSEEQAKRGFSLPEQMRELRQHAEEQHYEIVAEIEDPGYSRDTLNRPGMDEVRRLVAEGGVDAVIAWKRDRFGAHPWPGILEVEFAASECVLKALDDSGEGEDAEFLSGVKDLIARQELRTMVRRTRMGKNSKARSGKLLGSGPAPYGYRYVTNERGRRVGFEVDEPAIFVVRRLFELVGLRGCPMYAAGRTLESEGFMAPKGGPWQVSVIRNILLNDVYKPHTTEELRALGVGEDVLARLDPEGVYGVSFFGKRRVIGPARGSRQYRRTPRAEWVAVPIPDAGVPRDFVEGARERIADNPKPAFGGGGRDHELGRGVLLCGECGRAMTTYTSRTGGRAYWYYGCPAARTRAQGRACGRRCANTEMHRAEVLEREVVALVDGELLCDREALERHMDAAIERERAAFGSPAAAKVWAAQVASAEMEMDKLVRLYTSGRITDADYDRHHEEIKSRKAATEGELAKASAASSRVEEMERTKRAVLEMWGTGLSLGLWWMPPRLRRQVYGLLGSHVRLSRDRELTLTGEFDADIMRLTPEIEEYVSALRQIDRRLQEEAREDPPADYSEALERLERELATLGHRLRAKDTTSR